MPFLRKYNTLLVTGTTSIRIPIIKRAVVDFAVGADWTPGAGDVKTFVDAAGAANITNLPTAIASGNGAFWEFILTAAELSCKQVLVVVADAATKAVEDQSFIVETYGNASAMYAADLSLANLPANLVQILGTAVSTPATAGILDVNVKNIDNDAASASGTVTFPNATLASTTNITAGTITTVTTTTTATNVTTVNGLAANVITAASIADGAIDAATFAAGAITATVIATGAVDADALATDAATEIANAVWDTDCTARQTQGTFGQAIGDPVADTGTIFKATVTDATGATVGIDTAAIVAKTGSLTFTVAGSVDANIQQVNDVTVTGTGAPADEWGP